MKLTASEILDAVRLVRRELRQVVAAADMGDRTAAHAAAERAQFAAFDLKQLFSLELLP